MASHIAARGVSQPLMLAGPPMESGSKSVLPRAGAERSEVMVMQQSCQSLDAIYFPSCWRSPRLLPKVSNPFTILN